MVKMLAIATNRNKVPRKPRYFSGCRRPTSAICPLMAVTTISSRFCQRERARPAESLRVTSFEPTASTNIDPQVIAMVALSLRIPCCQKMMPSGLRCMTALQCLWRLVLSRRPRQPRYGDACHDKSEETQQQALPMTARDKVKTGEYNAHAQQRAAEK